MTDRLADLGQQSEPRYCLRDWLCVCVGMCEMLVDWLICLCMCGQRVHLWVLVCDCVSVLFVCLSVRKADCLVGESLCVCVVVLLGWGLIA